MARFKHSKKDSSRMIELENENFLLLKDITSKQTTP